MSTKAIYIIVAGLLSGFALALITTYLLCQHADACSAQATFDKNGGSYGITIKN